jgi:hypothetical protein
MVQMILARRRKGFDNASALELKAGLLFFKDSPDRH